VKRINVMQVVVIFFDRGLHSAQNQICNKDVYGLPISNNQSIKNAISGGDKIFSNTAEELLMTITKNFFPLKCSGNEHRLFMVLPKNIKCIGCIRLSFPSTRYAATDAKRVLNIHIDSQNPKEYADMVDSFMNQSVACFAVSQEEKRPVLLGVPRDSVVLSAHQ
jgi:hypothetical protein